MEIVLRTYLDKIKTFKSLRLIAFTVIVTVFIFSTNTFAAHPLITDDTGTQGKGKIQFEFNGEYAVEKEDSVTEKVTEIAVAFTYGLIDNLDLIAGIPYLFSSIELEDAATKEKGISDVSFEAKWKFYEVGKFSFALKPGISLPTGDEKKGLGAGKIGYSGFLINTINYEPFAFHLNLGYMRNENKFEEKKNLWHVSAACEYSVLKNLRVAANIGMEKNSDPDASDNPAFILGGIIYSVKDNIDLDAGLKYGLNKPEADYTLLAGITIKI